MKSELLMAVSRIDGYLGGIAAVDGDIRQFSAFAFLLESKKGILSAEILIQEQYAPQTKLVLAGQQRLANGFRELENELSTCIIRRPWGSLSPQVNASAIKERAKYLAFRLMDMIDEAMPEARSLADVEKFEATSSNSTSKLTFFSIRTEFGFLVLQFNDDSIWVEASS